MMPGKVTIGREAILRLSFRNVHGEEHFCDTVVDTGYTGTLTLPPSMIGELGLAWQSVGSGVLADGSEREFEVFQATIIWDGKPTTILIDEVDGDPLVGMSLMYGYELVMPIFTGASFTLKRISATEKEK